MSTRTKTAYHRKSTPPRAKSDSFRPEMTPAVSRPRFSDDIPLIPSTNVHEPTRAAGSAKHRPQEVYGKKHVHFTQKSPSHDKPRRWSPKIGLDDYEMKYQRRTRRPSFSGSAELGDVDRYVYRKEKKIRSVLNPPRKQASKRPSIIGVLLGGRTKPEPTRAWGERPWRRAYTVSKSDPIDVSLKEEHDRHGQEREEDKKERAEARAWMETTQNER